jgi:phosphopantothenoylcysteine decarboxylase/phosphopantothenate--cysteine ligase
MHEAVMAHLQDSTVVIKAAAVVDYRPTRYWNEKIKKTDNSLTLELERTPDILAEIGARKDERLLIGFAAETQDLIKHAKSKLQSKNLDWIIANDITKPGAGFGTNTNQVSIIDRNGEIEELPMMDKDEVAYAILDRIAHRRQRGNND